MGNVDESFWQDNLFILQNNASIRYGEMIEYFAKRREGLMMWGDIALSDVVFELLQRRVLSSSVNNFLNGDGLQVRAKV